MEDFCDMDFTTSTPSTRDVFLANNPFGSYVPFTNESLTDTVDRSFQMLKDLEAGMQSNFESATSFMELDSARANSFEDFQRNGIVTDLDDFDKYQKSARSTATSVSSHSTLSDINVPVPTNALDEFMAAKKLKFARTLCVFCRNNGEAESVYSSHVLKDDEGRTRCPILRRYVCPYCAKTGDFAHTKKYCPLKNSRSIGVDNELFF